MSNTAETTNEIRLFHVDVSDEAWGTFAPVWRPRTGPRKRPSGINPRACRWQ
jgi:hypothetical protein